VAGLNAQANGRRLRLFKPHEEKAKKAREKEPGKVFRIEVCGRPVPATDTGHGIRAVRGHKPLDPGGVRRYLEDKFGRDLAAVCSALRRLARSYPPGELAERCIGLFEQFCPDVPEGKKG
jgi:hypothetical protein